MAFSRRDTLQTVFYLDDAKIDVKAKRIDWDFSGEDRTWFELGGFTGIFDELMLGGCFRDDTWTRLTYLNQKPENYWPVFSKN